MSIEYITISTSILHDVNMNMSEKLIYAEIKHLTSLEHGCIAQNKHFSNLLGISKPTVSRAISSLSEMGYIFIEFENGSRNHIRMITLIKLISPPNQIDQPPLSNCVETKGNIQLNIQSNIQEYVMQWNNLCEITTFAPVRNVSKAREAKIRKREKEDVDFADLFSDIIQEIKESDFLNGLNDQGWKVSFDWIFHNDTNYLKILEGNYRNNIQPIKKTSTQTAIDKFFEEDEVIYAEVAE